MCGPPPSHIFKNNNLSFLRVPQPISSKHVQQRLILHRPSQSIAASPPQVPLIASAFAALHKQQQIQAPPIVHVERHQLRIASANSLPASVPEAIGLAESDREEEDNVCVRTLVQMKKTKSLIHSQRMLLEQGYVMKVPMVGDDGSKAKAIVVCHTDTSAWSPKHYAFQVLEVKPGGPPICHFLNSAPS
ncbi:hypothetical protein GH714_007828 [Hevea brasiliensis]|uniref:BURP domain-containing protein n=1 Tax=Hevea brasiliensis TaxID=3981 RepID=A0A6A6KAH9_HEVBR|nr:hypothetical protein GH714_007828 [Hevea brasiliensis]